VRMNPSIVQLILHLRWDPYTFITCGLPRKEQANFDALFTPFETLTWALILGTVLGWPLLLSLIENNFDLNAVRKDLDALFIGWAIIFEQSHIRVSNYTGRRSLYVYCTTMMIAFLVLCNAYKGENIKALTKSFEILPITNLQELLAANYTMYTKTKLYLSFLMYFVPEKELLGDSQAFWHQFSAKQLKKWNSSFETHRYGSDISEKFINLTWLDIISACNNTAMSGWKSELRVTEQQLKINHSVDEVFVGDEYLYRRHSGIEVIRYGIGKYRRNFYSLIESGVYTLLVNISNKPRPLSKSVPNAIEITGNIAIQFYILIMGLAIAVLGFFSEKVCWFVSKILRATNNNVLIHSKMRIFLIMVHQFELNILKTNRRYRFKLI